MLPFGRSKPVFSTSLGSVELRSTGELNARSFDHRTSAELGGRRTGSRRHPLGLLFRSAWHGAGSLTYRLTGLRLPFSHSSERSDAGDDVPIALRQMPDISALLSAPLRRADSDATRILYVGELTPYSGVADFLSCATAFAETSPAIEVEIVWAGRGDLCGVLKAQPVPFNLTQTFADPETPAEFAELFARCGLLIVPSLTQSGREPIAEAMASGLPVLGSFRCYEARQLVRHSVTGWLFDPLAANAMSAALSSALTLPAARLAEMRGAARVSAAAWSTGHLESVEPSLSASELRVADDPA